MSIQITRRPELDTDRLFQAQLKTMESEWWLGPTFEYTGTVSGAARLGVYASLRYGSDTRYPVEIITEHVRLLDAFRNPRRTPSQKGAYIPENWLYRPSHADYFEIFCYGVDDKPDPSSCHIHMRYAEYTLEFSMPVTEFLSLEQIQNILETTDTFMNKHLKDSTPKYRLAF